MSGVCAATWRAVPLDRRLLVNRPMPKRVIAVTIATLLCSTACADDGPAPPKPAAPAAAAPAPTTAAAPPPTAASTAAPAEMPPQASPPPAAEARLAQRIRIDEIAFFQGTKTSVAKAGVRVGDDKRALPVIAERDALVRVYVTPEQAVIGHDVTAEIYLETDGIIRVARQSATIAGPSREDDPGSTFDFHLPGENIGPNTRYLVRLIDESVPPTAASAKSAGQYPDTGTFEDLGAKHASKLRLVIVPLRYTGDGSGRLPDLSPPVLDSIRKRMLEFYPVPDVELTVRQTVSWNAPVLATGAGWDALLSALTQLRLTDGVPLDVYY